MGPDEKLNVDPNKNCQDCIFNLKPEDQTEAIGQPIDGTLCGRGKGPTSVPFATNSEARKSGGIKAKACGEYEEAREGAEPIFYADDMKKPSIVALPDPVVMSKEPTPNPPKRRTCVGCANFVRPTQAVEAGLWNVGICAARGIMIPNRSYAEVATECDSFRMGPADLEMVNRMKFLPEFTIEAKVKAVEASMIREVTDPQDYETDADVSDMDKEHGIRAWREIADPDGRASVLLPIFDKAHFSEDDQHKIPQSGDDEHPEQYVDHQGLIYRVAVLWMQLDETPALWGVAGTGKTEFYRHMAWLMGLPFHRISVTASTEVEDLAGKMHFSKEKGTYFEYGRIPKAWTSPGIVCLDEPNVGPPDVWQFVRPLTDNSKQLVLDMADGERVQRHPMAFLGMAMNPAWDVRNAGAEQLADADGSRLMHIYVELPNEKVEREIIKTRCLLDGYDITSQDLDTVMKIASDLRKMTDNETLPITWGVRQQIKVARALKWFTLGKAYKLAAGDYLEPEHQKIIRDVVNSNTPSGRGGSAAPKKMFENAEDRKRAEGSKSTTGSSGTAPVKPRVGAWASLGVVTTAPPASPPPGANISANDEYPTITLHTTATGINTTLTAPMAARIPRITGEI